MGRIRLSSFNRNIKIRLPFVSGGCCCCCGGVFGLCGCSCLLSSFSATIPLCFFLGLVPFQHHDSTFVFVNSLSFFSNEWSFLKDPATFRAPPKKQVQAFFSSRDRDHHRVAQNVGADRSFQKRSCLRFDVSL